MKPSGLKTLQLLSGTSKRLFPRVLLAFSILLCATLAGLGSDGRPKGKPVFEQTPPVTVEPTPAVPISESPCFSKLWQRDGVRLDEDIGFERGRINDRLRPQYAFSVQHDSSLHILSLESGATLKSVSLPEALVHIHRRINRDELFLNFKYGLAGTPDKGLLVITAMCWRFYANGSGEGVANAVYGCGFDGSIRWCFVSDTFNAVIAPVSKDRQIVLVEDKKHAELIGISLEGKEVFRVELPAHSNLVVADLDGDRKAELYIYGGISSFGYKLSLE